MIRISLPYIFNFAKQFEPLETLPDKSVALSEIYARLFFAQQAVEQLVTLTVFTPYFRTSYALSQELLSVLKALTSKGDITYKVADIELWTVKNFYTQYKTALLAELGSLDSYFVTQKGGFDTRSLLMAGENLFPPDLSAKVPEAIFDVREAGKSLAFEVATAAAFHVFRATESVLRKYYSHVTGGKALPKVRNIGVYLNALDQTNKGNPKVRAALKQMTELHRNPIIHPEAVLTSDEAIAIFGIARSAMTVMLAELPTPQPTTSTLPVFVPVAGS